MSSNTRRNILRIIITLITYIILGTIITEISLHIFNFYFPASPPIDANCRSWALVIYAILWISFIRFLTTRPDPYQNIEDIDTNIPALYGIHNNKQLKFFVESFIGSNHFKAIKLIFNFIKSNTRSTIVVNGPHRSGKTTVVSCAAKLYNNYEKLEPFLESLKKPLKIKQKLTKVRFIYEPAIRFNDMNEYMMNLYARFGGNSDLLDIIESLVKKDPQAIFRQLIQKPISNEESVLIIDDIDRLNPNEIITILKFKLLIEQKQIKNFKLVLIWDESNLLKVLKSGYPYIDRRYLDKYVDPVSTKQVSVDGYGQMWESIVGGFSLSKGIDQSYVMVCVLEEELKKELIALEGRIETNGVFYSSLHNEILAESKKLESYKANLISSYINLPIFKKRGKISKFELSNPIRSLYGDDLSRMLCEFRAGGCSEALWYPGFYCETIFDGQYIPRWDSTIKVINDINSLDGAKLEKISNIDQHCQAS